MLTKKIVVKKYKKVQKRFQNLTDKKIVNNHIKNSGQKTIKYNLCNLFKTTAVIQKEKIIVLKFLCVTVMKIIKRTTRQYGSVINAKNFSWTNTAYKNCKTDELRLLINVLKIR